MEAPSIDIGGRRVGIGHPVFIVAELSANHGQRLDRAIEAIHAAAEAGADAIKLQTYTPDTLTLNSNKEPFVVRTKNAWDGRTLYDLYREAMTPWEWHAELKREAEKVGLLLFSTPFDPTAVEYLEALDVPCHKVASFELNDLPLVEHVASRLKPVILSTGMASLGEIEAAVRVCRGVGNDQIVLLRCVSAYPAKPEAMHLASLATLRSFGTVVGLSDHTRDATVAIAAVTLGASFVEKHFICRRSDGGPDSFFSIEPAEFKLMVKAIRDVEKSIAEPRFGPSEGENYNARRSLFVARAVREGDILTCDDIRSLRPSIGLDPRHLHEVLGRPAAHDLEAASPLSWSDVAPVRPLPAWSIDDDPGRVADARRLLTTSPLSLQLQADDAGPDPVSACAAFREDGSPAAYFEIVRGPAARTWTLASVMVAATDGASEPVAAALEALQKRAATEGAVRLVVIAPKENVALAVGLKHVGFYHFVERNRLGRPLFACERRFVRFT